MSYEDWLAWSEGEGPLSDWVDGEVIVFAMPEGLHQDTLGFLYILLRLYTQSFDLGIVRPAPFEMKLSEHRAREPDLVFVAKENLHRIERKRVLGPADLAIELISDDSVTRDGREKRAEYATTGIREYWLFDPRPGRQANTFLQLAAGVY